MKAAVIAAKAFGSLVLFAIAADVLWRLYGVVVVGSYYATAPIFSLVFVCMVLPLATVAALFTLIHFIWKAK